MKYSFTGTFADLFYNSWCFIAMKCDDCACNKSKMSINTSDDCCNDSDLLRAEKVSVQHTCIAKSERFKCTEIDSIAYLLVRILILYSDVQLVRADVKWFVDGSHFLNRYLASILLMHKLDYTPTGITVNLSVETNEIEDLDYNASSNFVVVCNYDASMQSSPEMLVKLLQYTREFNNTCTVITTLSSVIEATDGDKLDIEDFSILVPPNITTGLDSIVAITYSAASKNERRKVNGYTIMGKMSWLEHRVFRKVSVTTNKCVKCALMTKYFDCITHRFVMKTT